MVEGPRSRGLNRARVIAAYTSVAEGRHTSKTVLPNEGLISPRFQLPFSQPAGKLFGLDIRLDELGNGGLQFFWTRCAAIVGQQVVCVGVPKLGTGW